MLDCQNGGLLIGQLKKVSGSTTQFSSSSFLQIINKPTHISQRFTFCTGLLFTNQLNLIVHSGVYPSLHFKTIIIKRHIQTSV